MFYQIPGSITISFAFKLSRKVISDFSSKILDLTLKLPQLNI